MLVLLVVLAAVALTAAVVVAQRGRAATRRLDRLAIELGDRATPSAGLAEAVDRLEAIVAERLPDAGGSVPAPGSGDELLREALEAMPLGVVLVDPDGRQRYTNSYARAFLEGRHGEAVVGQVIDEIATAAAGRELAERELQLFGPPRRMLYVSARPVAATDSLGVIVLIDDITEQERIDAIRRDFVANISHELRTPIGAMSLLAETLVDETDPEVVSSLAGRLSDEAQRLGDTVDDLLQLSRIEHGSDEEFQPVALQTVIATAHDRVRAAAEQQGVQLGVSLPPRPLVVRGDLIQLTSAVFNLFDNAIKYIGPDGGTVSVRGRAVGREIELVVQDSGIGIPRRDLDRVFERFYRVDQGRSRASGGTGLGLSIVRHVVVNHGGRISVDSTEGEGTTFILQFPAIRSEDETTERDPDPDPTTSGVDVP